MLNNRLRKAPRGATAVIEQALIIIQEERLRILRGERYGDVEVPLTRAAWIEPDLRNNFRLTEKAAPLFAAHQTERQHLARFVRKTRGTSIVANDVAKDA